MKQLEEASVPICPNPCDVDIPSSSKPVRFKLQMLGLITRKEQECDKPRHKIAQLFVHVPRVSHQGRFKETMRQKAFEHLALLGHKLMAYRWLNMKNDGQLLIGRLQRIYIYNCMDFLLPCPCCRASKIQNMQNYAKVGNKRNT